MQVAKDKSLNFFWTKISTPGEVGLPTVPFQPHNYSLKVAEQAGSGYGHAWNMLSLVQVYGITFSWALTQTQIIQGSSQKYQMAQKRY